MAQARLERDKYLRGRIAELEEAARDVLNTRPPVEIIDHHDQLFLEACDRLSDLVRGK